MMMPHSIGPMNGRTIWMQTNDQEGEQRQQDHPLDEAVLEEVVALVHRARAVPRAERRLARPETAARGSDLLLVDGPAVDQGARDPALDQPALEGGVLGQALQAGSR